MGTVTALGCAGAACRGLQGAGCQEHSAGPSVGHGEQGELCLLPQAAAELLLASVALIVIKTADSLQS